MNSKSEDEDYWQASDSKAFSFDEEEFSYKSTLFDSGKGSNLSSSKTYKSPSLGDVIFQGIPTVKKTDRVKRPLASLIPPSSLSKIFGSDEGITKKPQNQEEELHILRRQVENQWTPVPASKTIISIIIGQPYSFHLYRSLQQKTELLDEAVKSGDGNAILAVILFLSNTLKKSIFYQLLQDRPTAVAQYVQYLSTRFLITDLIDLLTMQGQTNEAAMQQFKVFVQTTQNVEMIARKISSCYQNHFSASDSKEKQFVNNYNRYLEWIVAVNKTGIDVPVKSTLASLSYLCKNYWNEPKTSILSPFFLSMQQGISDRQFQWTSLCARASLQAWDDIEGFFLTKGWIGGKKLKGVLSIEKVVQELHRQGAPNSVLAQYLSVMDNIEKRLDMSRRLGCHTVTIDIYVSQKDRQSLMDYQANLKPQSEGYLYAEVALLSPVKWKN